MCHTEAKSDFLQYWRGRQPVLEKKSAEADRDLKSVSGRPSIALDYPQLNKHHSLSSRTRSFTRRSSRITRKSLRSSSLSDRSNFLSWALSAICQFYDGTASKTATERRYAKAGP